MPFSTVSVAVSTRRLVARPAVRRVAVGALAAVTFVLVVALVGGAQSARARWGGTRAVVVATRDLSPGDTIAAGAIATRRLPAAVVPQAALAVVPPGAVVRQPIVAGEPLVATRLAPVGLTGTAALVPPGRRAVAIPRGPAGMPPVAVGDAVDVVAVTAPGAVGSGPPGELEPGDRGPPASTVAERATVVDVTRAAVTVTVPTPDAPRVAWALTNGAVILALAGE